MLKSDISIYSWKSLTDNIIFIANVYNLLLPIFVLCTKYIEKSNLYVFKSWREDALDLDRAVSNPWTLIIIFTIRYNVITSSSHHSVFIWIQLKLMTSSLGTYMVTRHSQAILTHKNNTQAPVVHAYILYVFKTFKYLKRDLD